MPYTEYVVRNVIHAGGLQIRQRMTASELDESNGFLPVHQSLQVLVNVGVLPLQDFLHRLAYLRRQPFEVKAFQDRTQMLVTTSQKPVPFQQILADNLKLTRWNLLKGREYATGLLGFRSF